jgi:hypothetical protein
MIKNLTVRFVLVAAAILASSVVPARAQSLAEVAQKEAARRKTVKQPAKVFTNDNLQAVPPTAAPAPAGEAAAQPAGAAPAEAAPESAAAEKEPPAPDPARDPEYWRKLMTDALQARDRNAFLMEAVQSRINALTTDFYARDDPYQRAQLGIERQKTLDELENMKKDQAAFEKKIADIQEKARRANIPPGWLR